MGRPFAAALKLSAEFKLEFDFGNADAQGEAGAVDFSGLTPLGPCPKCGANVYEQPMAYVCENAVGAARTCDFRSGRVILQQPIEAEQMRKLLREGRTDLLRGFVSNRTRRKFAAFLMRKPDGSTGFEFEPRPQRTPAGGKAAPVRAAKTAVRAPVVPPTPPAPPKRAKPAAKASRRTPAPATPPAAKTVKAAKTTRRSPAPAAPPAARRAAAPKAAARGAKTAKVVARTRRTDRRAGAK